MAPPPVHDTVTGLFTTSPATFRFDDGSEATGAQLVDEGRRLATVLHDDGFVAGDRIAIRMPNSRTYLRLVLACAVGRFVAVSVNTRWSAGEATSLVERSDARWPEIDDRWVAAARWPGDGEPDDPFVVFTTSGTTSRPKMVLHAQRSIAVHGVDAGRACGYGSGDVVLVAMPLCGTFGLSALTSAAARAGRVVVTDFELERTARLIERERVTSVHGSDDMFHRLLEHGADLSTIRLGGHARFNSSLVDLVERAEAAGAQLTGLYGMSEVQALFAVRDPSLPASRRRRAGGTLVSPRARCRVVDGELQVRGPSLMVGYLAEGGAEVDTGLTAAHLDDGWFRTGDLAVVDDDRSFEYLGRQGDAMRLGGFLVDPAEIEAVLVEQPGVDAAQVVAVDLPAGARPVAFVIGDADESTLISACAARLARFKVPVRVVAVDEFPTTPSANGTKIQRVELRRRAARLLTDQA